MISKHTLDANTNVAINTEIFNSAAWVSDALRKNLLLLFCIWWLLLTPFQTSKNILFEWSMKVGDRKTIERLLSLSYFRQFNLLWWKWRRKLCILTCKLRGWRFEKLIIKTLSLRIIPTMSDITTATFSRGTGRWETWILQRWRWRFYNWHWTWVGSRLKARVDVVVISRLIIIHEWKHGGLSCFEFFQVFIEVLLLLLQIELDIAFLYIVVEWRASTILH